MVAIQVDYQGGLRCHAVHGPSHAELTTDAPVDNHGKGEAFSPTDLVATALGACMLTIVGILAERHGIDVSGASAAVEKEMVSQPIRRIGKLTVRLHVPRELPAEQRQMLERGALTCPVHQSLHPDLETVFAFSYGPR